MIGSISKVRPAGHHHYYKYAHCYNNNDMNRVASTKTKAFFDDLDENNDFSYPLTGLRNLGNSAFSGWRKLNWFKDNLSKVNNNFSHLFSGVSGGVAKLDITLLGNDYVAVPGIQIWGEGGASTFKKRVWHLKFPNATTVGSSFQQTTFGIDSDLKLYAPKSTNMNSIFDFNGGGGFQSQGENLWGDSRDVNIEIDCRNVTLANRFCVGRIYDLSFPVDEDGNHAFGSGKPEVGRKWTTFPKLSSGVNMFTGADFSKEYTLAFLNDLPDWSSDTSTHSLTFSCHRDLAGDPDVNLALKKVDKNFNELVDLKETVSNDKGWTLTHAWQGVATKDEVLIKEVKERLNLTDTSLPSGYKRCVYLQDNGMAWINTNYIPTNTTGVWLIAKQLKRNHWGIPIGVGGSLYRPPVWFNGTSQGQCHSYWNGQTVGAWGYIGFAQAYEGQLNFLNSRTTTVRILKKEMTSSSTITTLPTLTQSSTKPMYMFANNNNGSKGAQWNGRIYRVKISEGTSIVRDFIPCLDASGKPCMRDVINGVNYYNQGTGADFDYELAPVIENDNGGSSGGDAQNVTLIDELVLSRIDSGVTQNFGKFSTGSPYVDSEVAIEDGYVVELSGMNSIGMLSEKDGVTCGPAIGTAPMSLIAPVGYSALMIDSGSIADYAKVSFNNGSYEILNTSSINDEVATAAVTELPMDNWTSPSLIGSAIVQWVAVAGTNIQSKIRNWKIYNGNTLVADMYPATHNDGRNGLYCSIRDKFLPIQYYS